jgi:proline dehydrogenase
VAGDHLSDALAVRKRCRADGLSATCAFWNSEVDTPRSVVDQYLAALEALAGSGDYLSIKLPALEFDAARVDEVATAARARGVRVHCDSHAIDDTGSTHALIDRMLDAGTAVGCTLPGRWRRSLDDVAWAAERSLPVRVVKGQWPDPADPQRDLRLGFLEVIDRLAGGPSPVAIATHDVPLAVEAERRLSVASTECTFELLFGLPRRAALQLAHARQRPARIYIPYGAAYLPYALSRLRQNPRIAWWLLKDLVGLGG